MRASIIRAFGHGIVMRGKDWDDPERVCQFYVETVTANIEEFLKPRPSVTIQLERADHQFPRFVEAIGATGHVAAAFSEWDVKHNASD